MRNVFLSTVALIFTENRKVSRGGFWNINFEEAVFNADVKQKNRDATESRWHPLVYDSTVYP